MDLQKTRDEWGRIVIRPINDMDEGLFRHCANGMCAVVTKEYNRFVEPMLLIHGVSQIRVIDRSKRRKT